MKTLLNTWNISTTPDARLVNVMLDNAIQKLKSEEKAENKNKENSENEVISLINQIENNNISFNLSNFSISHNESKEILFTTSKSEIKEENKSIICNQSCDLFDNNNNVNLDLKEIEERK